MYNPNLNQAIIQVVENQLNQNNPTETKETLDRLISEDKACDYNETIRRIAVVLVEEMYNVMKNKQGFDLERYVNKLKEL